MQNKRIYIRVDGNNQIGLGHLVRCLSLAKMLQKEFEITFVCQYVVESFVLEVKDSGFFYLPIEKESEFINMVKSDIIIVMDGYHFDTNYQEILKSLCFKLVCIDDLHDKMFYADLIINHAPNIVQSDYKVVGTPKFALGLKYVLLRPIFLERAKSVHVQTPIETVIVCFGGSDNRDITMQVAKILLKDFRFKKIILVIGAAYNFKKELDEEIRNDSRFILYNGVSSEVLCELIESAQLAIVPASGILQEVLSIGIRVISGMYVENQKNIFENYKKLGAFESAENFSDQEIIDALNNVLWASDQRPKNFIDGRSGDRLLKLFQNL